MAKKELEPGEGLAAAGTSVAAKDSIAALIVKMCDDVRTGNVRDEYKTLDAIANLYTAIK